MSTLEVLQTCPTQCKNLLLALGALDPDNSNTITFNVDSFKPRLSHQLTFKIVTKVIGRKVHCTVLEKGSSTSVISMSCWRVIGSPEVNHSPTTLKAFDGRCFQPYDLLPTLSIEPGSKSVSIQVEVVKVPLYYNPLLGRNWFYATDAVSSLVFHLLQFPHQGKIVSIDQLEFCSPNATSTTTNNVPLLG